MSIGFGGGAIIAGVITQHIDKIKLPKNSNLFYTSLFLSILATLLFILLGLGITKRRK